MGFVRVVVRARPVPAVALCAGVKLSIGIVVACQISRCIGTICAEFRAHHPPSAYRTLSVGRAAVALDLVGRTGGHLVPAIGSSIGSETRSNETAASIVRGLAPDIEKHR